MLSWFISLHQGPAAAVFSLQLSLGCFHVSPLCFLPSLAPFLLPGDQESDLEGQRDRRWSLGHGEGTGHCEERDAGRGRRAGEEGAGVRRGHGRGADGEFPWLSTAGPSKRASMGTSFQDELGFIFLR